MLDDLTAAREQMALSLSFHIVFAVFGVGLPWLLLYAEGRWLRTGDRVWYALARQWSKAFAVLFAVGAVSGIVLSVEFGLLWPTFMERYGGAIALPFTLESTAFFAEAAFLGLYLYGWDRLSPRAHWWCGVPVALAGIASTVFITTANAWMNAPVGIVEEAGRVVVTEPLAPFLSPTAPVQVTHMLVAALMATGAGVAAVYAWGLLRGRRDAYHRRGLAVGLTLLAALAPVQVAVGDWAVRVVAANQPVKLAAMEGLGRTQAGAPLSFAGVYDESTGELRGALELPRGLSLLLQRDPDAVVVGLDSVPVADQPPVTITHLAFNVMVGIGMGLLALAAWAAWRRWRRQPLDGSRWLLRAVVAAGPLTSVAVLAGWVVTEVGRQPYVVYGRLRTADALTDRGELWQLFYGTALLYAVLAGTLVVVLRRVARAGYARWLDESAGGSLDDGPEPSVDERGTTGVPA